MKEMDSCISSIFLNEDQDAFIQLFNLIVYENVNGRSLTAGGSSDHTFMVDGRFRAVPHLNTCTCGLFSELQAQ